MTNGSADAAQEDEVWDIVYGIGIVVVGGNDNQIIRNHVPGNALLGIAFAPNPGLAGGGMNYPVTGNVVRGNNVHGSSLADLATVLVEAGRSQLLRRQRLRHVGAGEHRAGHAV